MSDGYGEAVGHNVVGPTGWPVKQLVFIASDGPRRPLEIGYFRRRPSDIRLFPTPYLRRPKTVGHRLMPSDIGYLRRFNPYVRRLWPSEIVPFTVVPKHTCIANAVSKVVRTQAACATTDNGA
jgi:hypothetical protein